MHYRIIENYIKDLTKALADIELENLEKIINLIDSAIINNKTIFMIGNGGSSATPSHSTGDFSKELGAKVLCLTDNTPAVTAWANDTDYSNIFEGQLNNFLEEGDVLMAYSGSGNSSNVLRAIEFAKKNGAITLGFTGNYRGKKGGKLAKIVDHCIVLNSHSMERIEDSHLIINHIIKDSIKNLRNENSIT